MDIQSLFPQKIALNSNFCNRKKEQKHLLDNIQGVRPTLIVSPRRYGKTSLGLYVINKLKLPYAHVDLFPLIDISETESVIINGAANILASMETTPQKAMNVIAQFFSNMNISFRVLNSKIEVDMMKSSRMNTESFLTILNKLDSILGKKKVKGILFLDEFQRLEQFSNSIRIEATLRNVAQNSRNLCFIFSGSNRHLLTRMFDDSSRPLYKLCDKISLGRIRSEDFIPFIDKTMQNAISKKISIEAIQCILSLTKNHTYYVNVLCSRLIRDKEVFMEENVKQSWHSYALEEKSTVFKDLESLALNQFKVLVSISRQGTVAAPMGDEFLMLTKIAISSMRQSLNVLLEKDYLYQDQQGNYNVLDPLVEYILCGFS